MERLQCRKQVLLHRLGIAHGAIKKRRGSVMIRAASELNTSGQRWRAAKLLRSLLPVARLIRSERLAVGFNSLVAAPQAPPPPPPPTIEIHISLAEFMDSMNDLQVELNAMQLKGDYSSNSSNNNSNTQPHKMKRGTMGRTTNECKQDTIVTTNDADNIDNDAASSVDSMLDVPMVGAIDLSTLPPPPPHKDAFPGSWNGSETKGHHTVGGAHYWDDDNVSSMSPDPSKMESQASAQVGHEIRDGTLWEEEHSRVLRCRPFSPPIVPPIIVGTGNTNDLDNSTCDEHARDQDEIVTVCFIGATCRYD